MNNLNFCKDCIHIDRRWSRDWDLAKCLHPDLVYKVNLASGEKEKWYAEHARREWGPCGKSGKYFDPIVYDITPLKFPVVKESFGKRLWRWLVK